MRMRLLLISDTHGKLGIINELAAMPDSHAKEESSVFFSNLSNC